MPLMLQVKDHSQCKELEVIGNIIDGTPTIWELVLQDLNRGKKSPIGKVPMVGVRIRFFDVSLSKSFSTLPIRSWLFISLIHKR